MAKKTFDFSDLTSEEICEVQDQLRVARQKRIEKEQNDKAADALSSPEIQKAVKKLDDLLVAVGDKIKATDGVTLKIPCVLNLKLETGDEIKSYKANVAAGYAPSEVCSFYVAVASVDLADAQLTKKQASTFRHGVKEFVEGACSEIYPLFNEITKLQGDFKKLQNAGNELIVKMREKGINSLNVKK